MQCAPKLMLIFEQFYKYNFCGEIQYTAVGYAVYSVHLFSCIVIKTWGDNTMKKRAYIESDKKQILKLFLWAILSPDNFLSHHFMQQNLNDVG